MCSGRTTPSLLWFLGVALHVYRYSSRVSHHEMWRLTCLTVLVLLLHHHHSRLLTKVVIAGWAGHGGKNCFICRREGRYTAHPGEVIIGHSAIDSRKNITRGLYSRGERAGVVHSALVIYTVVCVCALSFVDQGSKTRGTEGG